MKLLAHEGNLNALDTAFLVPCQCRLDGKCLAKVELNEEIASLPPEIVVVRRGCLFFRPEVGDEVSSETTDYLLWRLVRPERVKTRDLQATVLPRPQANFGFVKDEPFADRSQKQIPLMWSVDGGQKESSTNKSFNQLSFTFWPAKTP